MASDLDINNCRRRFPSLNTGYIFADNAGGSQCLKDVADRIYDYLINTNVQLGADYSVSFEAKKRATVEPQEAAATLINASSLQEISFGSSSTMLVENLARASEPDVRPGEELVVSFADHEASVGPWVRLAARRGAKVVPWCPKPVSSDSKNPFDVGLKLEDLDDFITKNTRIVAFTACSNILGAWVDVKHTIARVRSICQAKGARKVEVCVDCVAYAPHRRIDVQEWDVDYAFFSYYKVYGPHTSVLYAREASLNNSVTSLAHYFLKTLKLQPGGPGYEVTYGTTGVLPYLLGIGRSGINPVGNQPDIELLKVTFDKFANHEERLMEPLIRFLLNKWDSGVRIVGPASSSKSIRAPTISFVVVGDDGRSKRLQSKAVVAEFDKLGNVGIRYGHFYSHRLFGFLGMDPEDGVVRISLVHYNTVEEVERIIDVLNVVIGS